MPSECPLGHHSGDVAGHASHGLVRAWCTDVPSLTDLDEDYSKRKSVSGRRQSQVLRLPVTHATFADALVSKLTKDEVVDALKSLHTDPSGHVDTTAVETLLGKVCAVAIDGAFTGPKSVASLQQPCRNLRIRWRDAARGIRSSLASQAKRVENVVLLL